MIYLEIDQVIITINGPLRSGSYNQALAGNEGVPSRCANHHYVSMAQPLKPYISEKGPWGCSATAAIYSNRAQTYISLIYFMDTMGTILTHLRQEFTQGLTLMERSR